MNLVQIRSFQDSDEPQVIRLWQRCGFKEDAVVSMGKRLEHDVQKG